MNLFLLDILHLLHNTCKLSILSLPPKLCGIIWSICNITSLFFKGFIPQHWHLNPALSNTEYLVVSFIFLLLFISFNSSCVNTSLGSDFNIALSINSITVSLSLLYLLILHIKSSFIFDVFSIIAFCFSFINYLYFV